ncbi:MAG: ATP-binding protein [Desulfurococcaceae archaeon]
MKPIGVVVSGSSPVVVPIHVYKGCENHVKEDAFVVIKDDVKSMEYFGVIRSPRMYDPLLSQYQRSSIIDNPELARQGREVVFEATIIRVLGVLLPEGRLTPPRQPPTPRSEVYLVESPSDVNLKLETGLELGKHKFSGIAIPLKPEALKYHIGVVGATGTGKSKLVVALVKEVLTKTNWRVIVFDHSGQDYAVVEEFKDKVIDSSKVTQDLESIFQYLKKETSISEAGEDTLYITLTLYVLNNGDLHSLQKSQSRRLYEYSEAPGKETIIELDEDKVKEAISKLPEQIETLDLEGKIKETQWKTPMLVELFKAVAEHISPKMNKEKPAVLMSLQKRFIESLNERKTSSKDILERLERDRLVVVDLSSVRQEERRYLVASVLRRIWNYIDERKQPVNTLVVIDEAHNYACQQGCLPSNELIERTAREGRKWGLGLVLASQRIIDFSTDVRNNINTFFFSKLQTPGDLDNLKGVLDLGGIEYEDIAILATREFYFAGLGNPLKYPVLIEVKQV